MSKTRLKTASSHKEATYGKMKKHKEQIQSILENLKTCVDFFHGATRTMTTGQDLCVSIFIGLLSSRTKSEEYLQ